MLLKNHTEESSIMATLLIICITICATNATSSPLYGKSKNVYVGSNQASLTTSDVQDFQVTLPTGFTISQLAYRRPFFAITQVEHLRIKDDWLLMFWTRILAFSSTGFTFQIENYLLLDQSITDPVEKFNKRLDQSGFITFTIVKYRYLVIRDSFPTIYFSKELDLLTQGTYVQGQSYYEKTFTLSQLTSPDPSPLVLDDYDTVSIHSFANAKFYDQNSLKSFGIQFSFVVKSIDTFMVKLVTKYKTWSKDFHLNVFIYNKKDFLNLKIKIYSTLMTFNSLLAQNGATLVQYYTPSLSPAVDDILYGLSGFDFAGYERIGWQIVIDTTVTNNHYKFTLTNLITTSAIPKIQITICIVGEFQCPNGQLLINEALDTCYSNVQNCPTGTMNSNVEVGKTGIMICKKCIDTCKTCVTSVSKCLSCYVQQNRQLNADSCVPVAHFYDDGTIVAKNCHGTCNSCSVSSTSCDSCYSNQNRELIGKSCKPLSGYYEDGNDVTPKCDSNCLECITTATTCTSCVAGKYLSSQTCLPCVWPCATCSDAIQCKTCVAGLTQTGCSCTCPVGQFLNYAGSQCSSCSAAMTGCQECDSSTHCSKCSVGYYLNSGSTCTKCKPGCINCNDLECLKCKDYLTLTQGSCFCSSGFYFESESISCKPCHKAIQNCQTCNSSTACTNCLNGSHLAPFGKSCLLDSQISQFFLASSPGQIQTCKDVSTILIVTFGVGIGLLVVIITTLVVCCLNAQAVAAKKRKSSESQQGRTDNGQVVESMKEIKSSVTRLNAVQLPGEV